ncbi:MAG: glycosyltransferase family 2 protein [Pseudomonadota bacterium]
MAKVTVAIPTYNGALYLEECLESAINQTFSDIEIVIVDDCSTDVTVDVVEKFAKLDNRIKIFRNKTRLGLVENWNKSIQYSTGEWIKFLFQDDVLYESCIEKMLRAAGSTQTGGAGSFVVGERNFVIENGVEDGLRQFYENSVVTLNDIFRGKSHILPEEFSGAILERGVGVNFVGEPTSVMIKREICFQYSFFNQNLVHLCDLEYWTRLGTNEGLVSVPERLSAFRVHNRSASAYNHAHRHFQLECLDKIILLHDYLYHPYYLTLRKAPDSEVILSHQLKHEIRNLAGHVQTCGNEKRENKVLFQSLTEKYPFLRKIF